MPIRIALLRGINVSGKNRIVMTELKRLCETIGFSRVQTYINSGNVLFESQEGELTLERQLEQGIEKEFGLSITVVVRTAEQLERAIAGCPYRGDVSPDGKNVNVGFLKEAPSQEAIARLIPYQDSDEFLIMGQEIYLLFRQGTGDSKLGNNLQKLRVPVTVRNWNTVNQLATLANAMQG